MYKKVVPAILILAVFLVSFATPVFADDFDDSPFGWNGDEYIVSPIDSGSLPPISDGYIPKQLPTFFRVSANLDSDQQLFYPNLTYMSSISSNLSGQWRVSCWIWDPNLLQMVVAGNRHIYFKNLDSSIAYVSVFTGTFSDNSFINLTFTSYADMLVWIFDHDFNLSFNALSVSGDGFFDSGIPIAWTRSSYPGDCFVSNRLNCLYTSSTVPLSSSSFIDVPENYIHTDSSFSPSYGIIGPVGQGPIMRKYKYNTVLVGYSYDPNREKPYNLVSTAYLNYDDFNSNSKFKLNYVPEANGAHAYLTFTAKDYYGPKGIIYSTCRFGSSPLVGNFDPLKLSQNHFELLNYSFASGEKQGVNYVVRYSDIPVVDDRTGEVIYDPSQGISPADQAILDKLDGIEDSIDKGFTDMGDHIDDVKDEIHDVYYGDVHFTAPDDYQNSLDDANGSLEDFQNTIDSIQVPSIGTDIVEGIVNNIKAYKPIFDGVYGFWGSGYPGTLLGVAVFIWTLFEVIKLGKSYRRIKRKNIYVTKVYNQGMRIE